MWKALRCWEIEAEGHSFLSNFPRTRKPLPGGQGPVDSGKGKANNGRTDHGAHLLGKRKIKDMPFGDGLCFLVQRVEVGVNMCFLRPECL